MANTPDVERKVTIMRIYVQVSPQTAWTNQTMAIRNWVTGCAVDVTPVSY